LLSYPATITLSNRTLNQLADLIRRERHQRRSRWRRLQPGQQALLVLAHLRNGDTYARLAAGFTIGTSTAWRYVRDDLLAALADDVTAAARHAARLAYASSMARSSRSTVWPTSARTTRASTSATASTCNCSRIPPAASSGPHQRCPGQFTT
jgi:hypothetical protein